MLTISTILLPADFSPQSEQAYHLASSLARDHGAHLVLLHVHAPEVIMGEMYPIPAPDPEEERHRLLDRLMQTYLAPPPPRGVEYLVKEGDPATEIVNTAREMGCGLIVMGTHGRSGVGRLLFGSVAEEVLRQAPCPVLTVKTPMPEPVKQEPVTTEEAVAAAILP